MGKVKEVKRTANVAWSPKQLQSIYLAAGTSAQQLDATFSTSASLEIFALDLASPGLEMPSVGSIDCTQRFHKLVWTAHDITKSHPSGLLIGGADNGTITLWSVEKIMNSESENAIISQTQQHVGPVRALDVNPFQPNLLASGASESEIYIWDLNNPSSAMSPGNKIHPLEDITCVAWNRQVQHILASTSPSGRSVVWDLRKNEPIIQVSDSSSRIRCKAIAWHPDVATQMVTASEDDHSPVIQMWDLRYATAPMRTLEHHTRGILSIAWCPQDSDLLLSAAKDNLVYCWNPNSDVPRGEVVYELPATTQWIFECHWCPRNPSIISTASFDGHVSLYSLLGGSTKREVEPKPVAQNATNDIFSNLAASNQQAREKETTPLKKPPKWLRRPCAASFSFGGKLVFFSNKGQHSRQVLISQVATEHHLLQQSQEFEEAVNQRLFSQYCNKKIQSSESKKDRDVWSFLKATFEPEPRRHYLQLLGYDVDTLEEQWKGTELSQTLAKPAIDVDELQQKLATVPLTEEGDDEEEEEEEEEAEQGDEQDDKENENATIGQTTGLFTSGDGASASVFEVFEPVGSGFPLAKQQPGSSGLLIHTGDDPDGMLVRAMLVGNFDVAVDICVKTDRMAEALILAVAGGSDLLQRTQQLFYHKKQSQVTKLMSMITNRNWTELAQYGSLENWREVLAALVTYAGPDEFAPLCDLLGERLEAENDKELHNSAALCYICSGNIDKFLECLAQMTDPGIADPLVLQDLVEKLVLLRMVVEQGRRQLSPITSPLLAGKISAYANLMASQGCLATALNYIEQTRGKGCDTVLHDRLYRSLGGVGNGRQPQFPFSRIDVLPPQAPATIPAPAAGLAFQEQPHPAMGDVPSGVADVAPSPATRNPYAYPHTSRVDATTPMGGVSGVSAVGGITIFNPSAGPQQQPTYLPPSPTIYGQTSMPGHSGPVLSQPPSGMYPIAQPPLTTQAPSPGAHASSSFGYPHPATSSAYYQAWNDPPMLKPKKTTSTSTAAPIMAPITAPVAPAPQDPMQANPGAVPYPVGNQPVEQKPRTPTSPVAPSAGTHPSEKMPIPVEHQLLVSAFGTLLSRCRERANNSMTRKKVEDISRKLEILYDLLRDSRLSPEIAQGLHSIAHDTQAVNYQAALARLNHMVSLSNLSEISTFMPGIKTLIQLGIQLRA